MMTSHLCGINYVPGTDVACVAWRYYRAVRTSGEAARKIKISPAPISSRFLCPRPPLLFSALNQNLQNRHATQARTDVAIRFGR